MFLRQKIIIATLSIAPKAPTKTELMKWLFLLKMESELEDLENFYDFVPYKFGPFSFLVFRELDGLKKNGQLTVKDNISLDPELYTLNIFGFDCQIEKISTTLQPYWRLSQRNLLDYVYDKYPWFASRSDLRPDLNIDKTGLRKVYTIGYEGKSIDGYLNLLLKKGIKQVIDVRRNPLSRKYGFSKTAMANLCEKNRIKYIHVPGLGIPSEYRRNLESENDYLELMDEYERNFLPYMDDSIKFTTDKMKQMPSVLTCYEKDQRMCHRGRIAERIASLTKMKIHHL